LRTHTDTTARRRHTLTTLSPLALVLAAGLAGCGTSDALTRSGGDTFEAKGDASLAGAQIDPQQAAGFTTKDEYMARGDEAHLPARWVSEAREGTAQNQQRRVDAKVLEVSAEARFSESMANSDAELAEGEAAQAVGYADASRTESAYNARIDEMRSGIEARQYANMAEHERREAFLGASVKEWQAEIERMRTSAENGWSSALAEHDRMLATSQAVRERGQAEIDRMERTADLTHERAVERVATLRSDARSVAEETAAEVRRLNKLISTTSERSGAKYTDLTQRARSLQDEMTSEIQTLDAKAEQYLASDADANYGLEVDAAQTVYETSLATAEEMRRRAEELSERDQAEIERRSAEARARLESARIKYEDARAWISGQYTSSIADVDMLRAEADRVEHVARSAFIKAERESRADALRDQAEHTRALSESALEKIEAQAAAEARRLEALFAKELARQAEKGEATVPSNTEPEGRTAGADDAVPEINAPGEKTARVKPDHVASFKSGLARAAKLRRDADADRLDAIASRNTGLAKFEDWFNTKQADHETVVAQIASLERKSGAEVSSQLSRAESMIASAETELERALVDAESGRTEVLATIETLKGNATSLEKKRDAKVRQLLAQADAAKRIGESEVASLRVQRDAAQRRGKAKSEQLLAEADALERSQRAVVAQMREDIGSARSILGAELSRLAQATESFLAIAEANYEEGVAMADAFERISIANASELTARHIASRKQGEADVEFMRRVAGANELRRDAEVARIYAGADEALGLERARDIARRGTIDAERRIANADAQRNYEVADALDGSVEARFDHRVAMTQAERDRAYAQSYGRVQEHAARIEMAQARAETYADLSNAALERLSTASNAFERTAQRNWDSRLATPGDRGGAGVFERLHRGTGEARPFDQITNVPTGDFE